MFGTREFVLSGYSSIFSGCFLQWVRLFSRRRIFFDLMHFTRDNRVFSTPEYLPPVRDSHTKVTGVIVCILWAWSEQFFLTSKAWFSQGHKHKDRRRRRKPEFSIPAPLDTDEVDGRTDGRDSPPPSRTTRLTALRLCLYLCRPHSH